jgi:hypothetical protein
MTTRHSKSVFAAMLMAGCLGVCTAYAQNTSVSSSPVAAHTQNNTSEFFSYAPALGEHLVDGYRFKPDVALGTNSNEPASAGPTSGFANGHSTHRDAAANSPADATIKPGHTDTTDSHFVGAGGGTSDLNLDAKAPHLVPGHAIFGGELQHSPTEVFDGRHDHYVFGIYIPF